METTNVSRETEKFIDSIAKRVYPLTEKEKSCLEKFGKMIINRGHLKKEIIQVISKYNTHDTGILSDSITDNGDAEVLG